MERTRAFSLACFARTFFLALVWLLIVRALLIAQSGVVPSLPGTLGGDLAGAFVLAVLLQLSSGLWRGVLIILLGCALYVAGMHLSTHGTLFQLAAAGKGTNPTFISGSLINAYLLLLPLYIFVAWGLHRVHRALVPQPSRDAAALTGSAIIVVAIYSLSFPSLTTPANNVVVSVFAQIPGIVINPLGTAIGDETVETGPGLEARTNFFHQQVSSRPNDNAPNVLLIMIEGLSGGYLPGISQYHDLKPTVLLDHLEATLELQGFRIYQNTLSLERQTDRGTFAIICGRYPDFRRPSTKMLDVAEKRTTPRCLPEKLREQGYHTAYWQAAPIEYMSKNAFMPRAGFTDVTGAERFGHEQDAEGWGPPDPVFFADVKQRLNDLNTQNSPWFVTLLNVGTHHPFDIGDNAEQELEANQPASANSAETGLQHPQQARRNAMKVMERTLAEFLETLEQEGTLDNTLVIITSDEAGGFVRDDHETLPLNSNMGILAVRPPAPGELDVYAADTAMTTQLDIPMTILDVTGHGGLAGDMVGRSLLATDHRSARRDLMLADTYTGLKYFLRESGQLLSCTELLTRCTSWSFDPERIFGSFEESDKPPFLSFEERLALFESATNVEATGE